MSNLRVTLICATGPSLSALADPAWVTAVAKTTGILLRALAAYAGVAISFETRTCGIGWNTLASIAANGSSTPPIFRIPLRGGAVANISDSDRGAINI